MGEGTSETPAWSSAATWRPNRRQNVRDIRQPTQPRSSSRTSNSDRRGSIPSQARSPAAETWLPDRKSPPTTWSGTRCWPVEFHAGRGLSLVSLEPLLPSATVAARPPPPPRSSTPTPSRRLLRSRHPPWWRCPSGSLFGVWNWDENLPLNQASIWLAWKTVDFCLALQVVSDQFEVLIYCQEYGQLYELAELVREQVRSQDLATVPGQVFWMRSGSPLPLRPRNNIPIRPRRPRHSPRHLHSSLKQPA